MLGAALLAVPVLSSADCPGTVASGVGTQGQKRVLMAGTATAMFVGGPGVNNCSCVPSGDATACHQLLNSTSNMTNVFVARWPSLTARTMDPVGGAMFSCPGGTCKVNNVGLPVELIAFGVQ